MAKQRDRRGRRAACTGALIVLALALSGSAFGAGGSYQFDGGDRAQRDQVRAALQVSRFDWDLVHETITIHIRRGVPSHALPGEIWLDSDLLDAGSFSWATVQDEYAAQVDFFLFTPEIRARLKSALGARAWCYENPSIQAHSDQGCERFSSMLPWAYWVSAENAYRPTSKTDESASMRPGPFRRLLSSLLAGRLTNCSRTGSRLGGSGRRT